MYRDRTPLGTYKPRFNEEMVTIGIRVPKSIKDKYDKLEDKTEWLRNVVMDAIRGDS